ncbi:hypothetical protein [Pleionea sp. CnH1-48]|nr:hypothetical protein [Pleionea sp. CnH1-48]
MKNNNHNVVFVEQNATQQTLKKFIYHFCSYEIKTHPSAEESITD